MLKEQAFQICGILTVCGGSATAGYFALKKNIFDKKNQSEVKDNSEEKEENSLLNPNLTPSELEKKEQQQDNNLQPEDNSKKIVEIKPEITPAEKVTTPKNVNAEQAISQSNTNINTTNNNLNTGFIDMIANVKESYGDVKVFYEFVAQNSCSGEVSECFFPKTRGYVLEIMSEGSSWGQEVPIIDVYSYTTTFSNLRSYGSNNLFKDGTKYLMEIKKDEEHKLLQGKDEKRVIKLQWNSNRVTTIKTNTLKELVF